MSSVGGTSNCSNWRSEGKGARGRDRDPILVLALGKPASAAQDEKPCKSQMELGKQTRGPGASGSFREDRAGAPPALRSIQWSLHRGTSLTSRTGGQLGTEAQWSHARTRRQPTTIDAVVGARHHGKKQRIYLVVVAKEYASRHPVCLVLLCRRVAVSYFQIGMPDSQSAYCLGRQPRLAACSCAWCQEQTGRHTQALGAWASGGRAHMIWYDKIALNWP